MTDTLPLLTPVSVKEPSGLHETRYVGEILGGTYRIARRIGAGGMADVYEVEHLRLGSRCAAKVLRRRSGDDTSTKRFVQEGRLLARLESDHIVTIYDVGGVDEEAPFYVMELLKGQDLRKLVASAVELAVARAVKIISDACRGLIVAHAAGLVHRDLKPENLFVTHRDSGEEICKILDFGVAKTNAGNSTENGALVGTVRYMAPEQIEPAGTVSPRADVRGLGAILYECLTGRPPHVADTVERLLFKILHEAPSPVRTHRPSVPEELDAIVMRALERDPARRFSSAAEFADALAPFIVSQAEAEATTTESTGPAPRTPRARQGRNSRTVFLGIFSAFTIGTTVGALAFGGSDSTARTAAPAEPTRAITEVLSPVPTIAADSARPPVSQTEPTEPTTSEVSKTVASATEKAKAARVLPRGRSGAPAREESERAESTLTTPLVKIDSRNPYGP